MEKQTCNNCACDSVCDHNWNGWETCGNWQPVLVRCEDCDNWDKYRAVDAVPVVRCKDCAVPHNRWTGCPKMNGTVMPPDGFCSFGERKADHETD